MTLTGRPAARRGSPRIQRLVRALAERHALSSLGVAGAEGRAGVAVHTADEGGDVDLDDVAVGQRTVESGMPWQMTSFTDVQSDLGNPCSRGSSG